VAESIMSADDRSGALATLADQALHQNAPRHDARGAALFRIQYQKWPVSFTSP
jgi:hypothetical protein